MPPVKLNQQAVKAAYVKAYLNGYNWQCFDEIKLNFLKKVAFDLNSRLDILVSSLLGVTSAILGPATTLSVKESYAIQPNLYIVVVANPGLGKTPVFSSICERSLEHIQGKKDIRFVVDDFTKGGLLSSMERNDGFCFINIDEFCQAVDPLLKGHKEEVATFRASLNKFFSGTAYSKDFASKKTLIFRKSCLSVLGFTQPGPFAEFYRTLVSVEDGLADRFLVLSVPIKDRLPADNYVLPALLPENWCSRVFLQMYNFHQTKDTVRRYSLTVEAQEYYANIVEAPKPEMHEKYEQFELSILAGEQSASQQIPDDSSASKDMEITLKLALALHCLNSYIKPIAHGFIGLPDPPNQVPVEMVKAAGFIVSVCRMQVMEYRKCIEAHEVLDRKGIIAAEEVLASKQLFIPKEILRFPGKAVSVQMLNRRNRQLKSAAIMQCMIDLHSSAQFTGKYKKIGKNKHVFYKASPFQVSLEKLESYDIGQAEYEDAWNKDMTENPCPQLPYAWPAYYEELMRQIPEMPQGIAD